jgi:hypothetical protein
VSLVESENRHSAVCVKGIAPYARATHEYRRRTLNLFLAWNQEQLIVCD